MNRAHRFILYVSLISLFGNWGIPVSGQIQGRNDTIILDRVLAVVGNKPILQYDLESEYRRALQQGITIEGDLKCAIFEEMLKNKLLVIQAEIDSVEVTDEEIDRLLDMKLDNFILTVGSEEALESMWNKSIDQIKQDLFEQQKEEKLVQLMSSDLTMDVAITPSEVRKFFNQIPENQIPLRPETVELQQIVIKPRIDEAERQRIISQLNDFRERIQSGESMTTLAVIYSEDEGSAVKGGEVGLLPRSALEPEYTAAAFSLAGDDVSRPVKTEVGYHLIQTIERRGDLINTRHILLRPKPSTEERVAVQFRLDSIADYIRSGEYDFAEAVKRFSEDEKTRNNDGLILFMTDMGENYSKIQIDQLSASLRSRVSQLNIGEISEPFESMDEKGNPVYKIIRVKSRTPAHKASLKTDYEFIQELALLNKQEEVIDEWVEKKIKTTYHRINPDYGGCDFRYKGWVIQ